MDYTKFVDSSRYWYCGFWHLDDGRIGRNHIIKLHALDITPLTHCHEILSEQERCPVIIHTFMEVTREEFEAFFSYCEWARSWKPGSKSLAMIRGGKPADSPSAPRAELTPVETRQKACTCQASDATICTWMRFPPPGQEGHRHIKDCTACPCICHK